MLPRGAYAPVPTPLDGRLEFDPAALQSHLAWLSSQGLDGALILGTNGEFPSLSLSERLRVAESAAAANSGLRLMLGVGSCSLVEVLEMVGAAAALGYQSVLCPPPFYFRGAPVAGFAAFFREVLDHAEIPVLLYHIPQVTGVPISEELLEAIDGHPRLAGVKDSSGDPAELARLSKRFAERVYMVGSDRLVTACSRAGGRGSISAAASVAPALVGQADRGQEEQNLHRQQVGGNHGPVTPGQQEKKRQQQQFFRTAGEGGLPAVNQAAHTHRPPPACWSRRARRPWYLGCSG